MYDIQYCECLAHRVICVLWGMTEHVHMSHRLIGKTTCVQGALILDIVFRASARSTILDVNKGLSTEREDENKDIRL